MYYSVLHIVTVQQSSHSVCIFRKIVTLHFKKTEVKNSKYIKTLFKFSEKCTKINTSITSFKTWVVKNIKKNIKI